jgi:hypothetical protein
LKGFEILVVEDQYLISEELKEAFAEAGKIGIRLRQQLTSLKVTDPQRSHIRCAHSLHFLFLKAATGVSLVAQVSRPASPLVPSKWSKPSLLSHGGQTEVPE